MLDSTWSSPYLTMAALPPLFLAATGILAWVTLRKLRIMRVQTEERLEDLARRLRKCESRIDGVESSEGLSRRLRSNTDGQEITGPTLSDSGPPRLQESTDRGEVRDSPTLIAIPNLADVDRQADPDSESALRQRHSEVWELAAAGVSPGDIARQTGHPKGEVELIVGLYRQLRSTRGPLDHARSY
jgi:hypothetical protein